MPFGQKHLLVYPLILALLLTLAQSTVTMANTEEWVSIHVHQVNFSTASAWEKNSEVKLYIVAYFDGSQHYETVLTYPHNGTINVTPDASGSNSVEIKYAGLSLAIPADVNLVTLEITAVDVDQLNFDSPLLTRVVDDLISRLPNMVASVLANNKSRIAKPIGRALGSFGTIAYDYITEEDMLGYTNIQLYRQNGWIPVGYPVAASPDLRVLYEIRDAEAVTVRLSPAVKTPINTTTAYIDTARLNVRNGAGQGYAILTTLPQNTQVEIIAKENGWSQIRLNNGQLGWVASDYLRSSSSATAQPPLPKPTLPTPDVDTSLRAEMERRINGASVSTHYASEAKQFGYNLVAHLDDFQSNRAGIMPNAMRDAILRTDAGSRVNGIVNRVWDDWRQYGVDHNSANPADHGQSPFRQLIIRLIQGRQGPLSAADQRALYSLFTRNESNWSDNTVRGVIGAINRDFYQ